MNPRPQNAPQNAPQIAPIGAKADGSEAAALREFHRRFAGEPVVLLRLAAIEGSSYQPLGAFKWVAAERSSVGMISGGCLEDHFIDQALAEPLSAPRCWQQIIDSTQPADRLLGTALGCRGRLTVSFEVFLPGCPRRDAIVAEQLAPAVTVHIVGGGSDVQPVAELLRWRGWGGDIFTRTPEQRIPGFRSQVLSHELLATALSHVRGPKILAVLTHHFPTDLDLLHWLCHRSSDQGLDYLGLLGSRQRRAQLLADLRENHGMTLPARLEAVLHAPLGLPGFGKGQHAVALSLISQLQQLFASEAKDRVP